MSMKDRESNRHAAEKFMQVKRIEQIGQLTLNQQLR
jgi:hypothetical protein